jgi:hypothetical protein
MLHRSKDASKRSFGTWPKHQITSTNQIPNTMKCAGQENDGQKDSRGEVAE